MGCDPSLSLRKTRKLEHLLRVENIFEITWILCLFWQRKFKVHIPHLSSRVHPASDFFCVLSAIILSKSTWSRVARGSAEISWKESCLWLGMLSNGFTSRPRRSFSTILSSISDDLWLCAEEGFVYPPDGPDGQRFGQRLPEALPDRSISLSVLLGPIALMAFSCLCYGFLETNQSRFFSQHLLSNLL